MTETCKLSQQPTANSQQPTANSQRHNHVLVSIIIPAYNTEKYIHRAIESSLRQTHSNVEVIVVDDGSKDNTLEVSRSYAEKDSRVRVFHKENGGVSSARNMGIRESHGKYMMFLDSDDWLEDNAVEYLTNIQEQHPRKLITSGKYFAKIHEDGNIYRTRRPAKMNPQEITDINELTGSKWGKADQQSACYKIFISDVIRENNITFNENLINKEDGLFVFEYLHHVNGLVYVDAALWNVLSRPGSATRLYSPKMTESAIEAFRITMNYPGNTQAVKDYWTLNYANAVLRAIVDAGQDNERIDYLRKEANAYTKTLLLSKHITLKQKILHIMRRFSTLYRTFLSIRRRKKSMKSMKKPSQ